MAFTIGDAWLVAATLTGPVVAVQVQKWIERARADHESRVRIFKTLMMTRATRLAPDHIRALNMITIEFRGPKFAKVRNAWKDYFSHLAEEPPQDPHQQAVYYGKRPDLFVDLLQEMADTLAYKEFNKTEILKEGYATRYHEEIETDANLLRKKLVEILTGKGAIPMSVVSFPADTDAIASQKEYFDQVARQLKTGAPIKVEIVPHDDPGLNA